MTHLLLVAILAGLGGMLGWGLADFFAKKTIEEIGDVPSLLLAHLFGAAAFSVVLVAWSQKGGFHVPSGIAAWAELAGFGVLQAVVYLLVCESAWKFDPLTGAIGVQY